MLLQYADDNGLTSWHGIGPQLFDAYHRDVIATSVGLVKGPPSVATGNADPADQMLTEIAYSAIDQGAMPLATRYLGALFASADELGRLTRRVLSALS